MSEPMRGSPCPLFDRLGPLNGAVAGTSPLLLGAASLRRSIGTELARILSSRSRRTFDGFCHSEDGVVDYGIPDSSSLSMRSMADRQLLASAIDHAISLFEPRLIDVIVQVIGRQLSEQGGIDDAAAQVRISGTMRMKPILERATFVMTPGPSCSWTSDASMTDNDSNLRECGRWIRSTRDQAAGRLCARSGPAATCLLKERRDE